MEQACCLRCHRVIDERCERCFPREEDDLRLPPLALRMRPCGKPAMDLLRGNLPALRCHVAKYLRMVRKSGLGRVRRTCAGLRIAETRYRAWQVYEVIIGGATTVLWIG
jgi:hypothetical protein